MWCWIFGTGKHSRLLQLEHRYAGEAAVEIVGILEEARQRREERKRWERSFAVLKYCWMKPFSLTICVVVTIFLLLREQKNRVAKVKFALSENFQNIILSRTRQPVPVVQLFFSISTFKVLLEGIYDEDSTLHKLRSPRCVVEDVMPIVWEHLTWDWQVRTSFCWRLNCPVSTTYCNFKDTSLQVYGENQA